MHFEKKVSQIYFFYFIVKTQKYPHTLWNFFLPDLAQMIFRQSLMIVSRQIFFYLQNHSSITAYQIPNKNDLTSWQMKHPTVENDLFLTTL